jgi:hypothetical protein
MQNAKDRGLRTRISTLEPLTVSVRTAQFILDIGNTKFWLLVKQGQIELVEVGRRRMVVYRSLKALAQPVVA